MCISSLEATFKSLVSSWQMTNLNMSEWVQFYKNKKCNQSACCCKYNQRPSSVSKPGASCNNYSCFLAVVTGSHTRRKELKRAVGLIKMGFFFWVGGDCFYFKVLRWHRQHLCTLRYNLPSPSFSVTEMWATPGTCPRGEKQALCWSLHSLINLYYTTPPI